MTELILQTLKHQSRLFPFESRCYSLIVGASVCSFQTTVIELEIIKIILNNLQKSNLRPKKERVIQPQASF